MKQLILIRHGKSSWENRNLTDIERPLKNRGKKEGPIMGKLLRDRDIIPDLIISSPAKRAHSTAKLVAAEVDYSSEHIRIDKRIYFEGTGAILHLIKETPDSVSTLFLFGHNPDFSYLADIFSSDYHGNVPTTGVVGIHFTAETWAECSEQNGRMVFMEKPSDHR